jgi:hypothetical protein
MVHTCRKYKITQFREKEILAKSIWNKVKGNIRKSILAMKEDYFPSILRERLIL